MCMQVYIYLCIYVYVCVRVCMCLGTFRDLESGLSETCVNTRKDVTYAGAGQSQGKLWRRLVSISTSKSFFMLGYGSERQIEPSHS